MDSQIELQEELLQLISSLRRFIQVEKGTRGYYSGMFLKGDSAHHSDTFEEIHEDGEISYDTAVTLDDVQQELGDCRRCGLYQGRKNIVLVKETIRLPWCLSERLPVSRKTYRANPLLVVQDSF